MPISLNLWHEKANSAARPVQPAALRGANPVRKKKNGEKDLFPAPKDPQSLRIPQANSQGPLRIGTNQEKKVKVNQNDRHQILFSKKDLHFQKVKADPIAAMQ